MTTLRWLHLSDFHTGKDEYGQNRLFQYITKHVKFRVESGLAPDFIFITGDIANKGQPNQYQDFNENFLLPLIELLPLEAQGRVYLIPGNHDVDRSQTRAVHSYDILVKIPDFFDPNEKGQFERNQAIFPRFRAYTDNDLINTGEHWLVSQDGTFANVAPFSGKKIGVLSVNTAWLSCSDNDRHQLSPGKPLLEDGLEKIEDCDVKFVLGHHPLDWFLDEELESIRSLLGRQNVIYLHGHMHKNKSRYEEGAGYPFLTLQSGAGFQARENDLWVNRFLWCEMDFETRKISIEPLQWSHDNQEWVLDSSAFPEKYRQGDRWIVSLPAPLSIESKPVSDKGGKRKSREIPEGWVIVDTKYLKGLANELTAEQALGFFDGRAPVWREALSPQIPKREIAYKLFETLESARKTGGLQVTVLTGAAGEGKTTVLLQTVCELVSSNTDWHVLWHDDTSTPLPAKYIADLPLGGTWLIVSDDAELIVRRVYETTQLLTDRRDIQFLLCCRDTDWKAEGADRFDWRRYNIKFSEMMLRGLSPKDAEQVVSAWSKYGKEGLKRLDNLSVRDASLQLIEAAKSEEVNRNEGTFFGAILQVRLGDGFKDHIRDLIEKLNLRSIGGAITLRDAFAYIAAMHAENLQILSKEVIAAVLNIDLGDLKRKVLFPLGEEAAITTNGRFVFTRHRSIANAALQILSDEFGVDSENLYIELLKSAISAGLAGTFVPEHGKWIYLCDHFFDKEQVMGIRLAQTVLELFPNNPFIMVKLAQLYRKAGQPEKGVQVFRSAPSTVEHDRGYCFEWGVVEGNVGNHAIGVWLSAFSLCDEVLRRPPDNERAKISLTGISFAFAELYDKYNNTIFIQACGAAAQLGLKLFLDPKTHSWLNRSQQRAKKSGVEAVTPQVAMERLKLGIIAAWEQREEDLPNWVAPANSLNFSGLTRLLKI